MTALKHFRKPEVEVHGDEVIVVRNLNFLLASIPPRASHFGFSADMQHSPDERAPLPLAIHHNPLCLTFAYFEDLQPILDPTHLEETLASGTMTVTLNAQRELCVLSKAGGSALSVDDVMAVVRVGVERVRESVKQIEDALVKDAAQRVVEVR